MAQRRSPLRWIALAALLGLLTVPSLAQHPVSADSFGTYAFQRLWNRTDLPVAQGSVSRAWVWGSQPFSGIVLEQYAQGHVEGQTGSRRVQYFDKGRMEITDSSADASANGYVTFGLLARELITGQVQLGDNTFRNDGPARIDIAGDLDDQNAPTYASLTPVLGYQPIPQGWPIAQTIDRAGKVSTDPSLAPLGVTAGQLVPQTNHRVASVFWDYLSSTGPISVAGSTSNGALFSSPLTVSGYPLTEAYWATVSLGGKPTRILIQAFERRVLTYTPTNGDGWKVESNNVGQHYFSWRYGAVDGSSSPLNSTALTFRDDGDGNLMALGTLRDDSRAAWEHVQVTVTLYDRNNQPMASKSSFLDFSLIGSGEQLPFRVWFDGTRTFDHYRVSATGGVSLSQDRDGLAATDQQATSLPGGGILVSGSARNNSDQAIQNPLAIVALYDDSGDVVDYAAVALSLGTLDPGLSGSYSAVFAEPPAAYSHFVVFFSS